MHDHAGTVIGGVQLRIRPHEPSARSRAKVGRSTSHRSTSVGSRQSRPMMQSFMRMEKADADMHGPAPSVKHAFQRARAAVVFLKWLRRLQSPIRKTSVRAFS